MSRAYKKARLPLPPLPQRDPDCSIKDCGEPAHCRGWCKTHYQRWQRTGDPLNPGSRIIGDDTARLLAKVNKNGPLPEQRPELGPCWVWTAAKQGSGYGMFYLNGRQTGAHVASYLLTGKPIPEGAELDHLCHPGDGSCPRATCRHILCVNPAHLEPVTRLENIRRSSSIFGANMAKTHCPKGHEYTPENTRIRTGRSGNENRSCKQCQREANPPTGKINPMIAANAAKTHCPKGHEYTPENTIIDRSVGGKNGSRRCRTCRREQKKRSYQSRKVTA